MTATDVHVAQAPPASTPTSPRSPRRLRGLPAAAFLGLLCAGWQIMSVLVDSVLVPGVPAIAAELVEIVVDGSFVEQLGVTVLRVGLGFALAFVVAVGIGIAMGRSEFARRFFEPAVLLGLTIPGLVWALLCVIWFGIDLINPVAAVALSSAPALMLTIYQGTRSVDPDLLEMAHVYRFSRVTRLRRLWLPALAPSLFAGARLGLSLGWKVIVLVEVFGMSSGVGYQLNNAFAAQNVAAVLAWTLLFAIVMAVLEYGVLQALERRAGRWRKAVTV
ncbi:NitT/TauT family transport system permease protein [Pseudonocardia thermophila]|uniref:NitT/TauT family transport system permease protein n=1 Tax=Pseudonocardia thermophila TaxID=1848 RepID=A0A1M6XX71_PSETH|nr:ABC transporter permease [Pseudonocardia thermophila]SHL10458.1 NitT/TauT family transport system permease protein [Pseudonocardia thermophila]